ncbi:MAG TPA: class I SAM-dependent DNA methyltransferase [Bryobacteraceae bacterium]|nr:class I SAM-dependent DNA methyltransferase [Bryobacteraceae bacterium]
MDRFQEKVSFIWSIADLLRGDYKASEYGKIILPFTLLVRLDGLKNTSGFKIDARRPAQLARDLKQHMRGLHADARAVFDCFRFNEQIDRLAKSGLLAHIVLRFGEIDLRPQSVSNREMGYVFEELIRKFSEQSGETAGEHFTPREVIRLMVHLVFDEGFEGVKTLYDPACGTGGMLSVAEEYLTERNPRARLEICGQELNPESYAVCQADAVLKGHPANCIAAGNTFVRDAFAGRRFDYMLCNPPFGVEWKKSEKQIREEHRRRGFAGRFGAGLPRVSDGALLFLQHMLSKMNSSGSRIGVIFNGSPLFTGDAGSGESNIRQWILENDWLEAIVALPDQLFYNTGLATYIWILTNRKTPARRGKVQLINAVSFCSKMHRSLGHKRNQMTPAHIDQVCEIHRRFVDEGFSKILGVSDFGYRSITIERPLRLNFQFSPRRLEKVQAKFSAEIMEILDGLNARAIYRDQRACESVLDQAFCTAGKKLGRTLRRKIREVLGEQDDRAEIYRDAKGRPVPDPDLRDSENIPLDLDVHAWFRDQVLPHAPDAWIDEARTKTGYAIPFARHFFEPEPMRPLADIDREITELECQAQSLLRALREP